MAWRWPDPWRGFARTVLCGVGLGLGSWWAGAWADASLSGGAGGGVCAVGLANTGLQTNHLDSKYTRVRPGVDKDGRKHTAQT